MSTKQSNITLPFSQFISLLLRDDWFTNVSPELAANIAIIDKEELYVHVQFEHHEMEKWLTEFKSIKLDTPRVWSKKYWLDSQQNWIVRKAKSEEMRRLYWLEQENIEVIQYRLARKMNVRAFIVKELAEKLVKTKNIAALQGLGIADDIKFE